MFATRPFAATLCLLTSMTCLASPVLAERPDRAEFSVLDAADEDNGAEFRVEKTEDDGTRVMKSTVVCTYVPGGQGYMYVYGSLSHPDSVKFSAAGIKMKQGAWLTMNLRYYEGATLVIERTNVPVEFCKASYSASDKDKNLSFYDDADQAKFKLSCSGDLTQAFSLSPEEAAKFNALAGDKVSCKGQVVGDIQTGCFRGDTSVATERGAVAIRDVQVGDMVWSWDETQAKKVLARVSRVYVRPAAGMRMLSIGDEMVYTTNEHPFYIEGKGWTKADSMAVGDRVKLAGGEAAIVTANATADSTTFYAGYAAPPTATVQTVALAALSPESLVYNIEVDNHHNFFVGKSRVLVHNK